MESKASILPPFWNTEVQRWVDMDAPSFDIGGYVVGDNPSTAHLFGKSDGSLAGVPFFNAVFEYLGCHVEWFLKEGDPIRTDTSPNKKVLVATVTGSCRKLLLGERTALNILSRASGVATLAKRIVDIAKVECHWSGFVSGTRKTTPGTFRIVEKYALLVAGASTHRMDLSQMTMLKDNHLWACGGNITEMVHKARQVAGFSSKIEVECNSLSQAIESAEAGADVVMLDNFDALEIPVISASIKQRFPHVCIEVSGGINESNIRNYLCDTVDVVSMGCLTHGYSVVDFSLKIQQN